MSYRDENEGLRGRVAELEAELAEEKAKVARLTGAAPSQAAGDSEEHGRVLDAPSRINLERTLELEIGDTGFEAIAAMLRPRVGVVSQVVRTLTANGFSLSSAPGTTHVRVTADYRSLAAGAVSCSVLAGGFAALVAFALAHDLVLRSLAEAHVLWMIPTFIVLMFPLVRGSFRRLARAQATQQRATMEAVLELARRHALPRASAARVRVAKASTPVVGEARDAEALAEEEAATAQAPPLAFSIPAG